MRSLFLAGLVLGAELSGCGALVTLPPEPGETPAIRVATDASVPPPITVERAPDAGLDARLVESSAPLESGAKDTAAEVDVEAGDSQPALATSCPATPPNLGDPCALPASGVLRCEYADGDSGLCFTLAYCDGQHWGLGQEMRPTDSSVCLSLWDY